VVFALENCFKIVPHWCVITSTGKSPDIIRVFTIIENIRTIKKGEKESKEEKDSKVDNENDKILALDLAHENSFSLAIRFFFKLYFCF
jgi:hypothetical protein